MLTILSSLISTMGDNLTVILLFLTAVGLLILILLFAEAKMAGNLNGKKVSKATYLTSIAFLSAISGILMLFEFPLPFVAPGFYKVDFSEVPIVVGALAFGPVAGVVIEFVKIMINLFVNGTTTAFVGEIANFIIGITFVIPVSMMYYAKKTKRRALVGLLFGTAFTTVVGVLLNAYVLLPVYAGAFGGMEKIVAFGTAVNANINSVLTFCLLAVAPFNVIKFGAVSILIFSIYGSLDRLFKKTVG